MKTLRNFITLPHKSAKRDYLDRILNEKAKFIHMWIERVTSCILKFVESKGIKL
mgnify:CR=1 FL=1